MARTKSRRRHVPRPRTRNVRPVPDILSLGRFVLRPELAGTLLIVLAAALLPQLLPLASVFDDVRDGLVRTLGLHAVTLVILLAASGSLLAVRRTSWILRHRRHVLGGSALLIFSAGILGHWAPDSQVGTVQLASHSAGGDAGRLLTDHSAITTAWSATLPLGFSLLWPRTSFSLLRWVPSTLSGLIGPLWRLGVHHTVGRITRRDTQDESPNLDYDVESAPPTVEAAQALTDPQPLSVTNVEPSEEPPVESKKPATQIPMDMATPAGDWRHSSDGWQLPPTTLLAPEQQSENGGLDSGRRARVIEETLASFGVDASVTQINEGPAVTQFGVEPGWDVRTRTLIERDSAGHPLLDDTGQPRMKEVEVSRTRVRVNRITRLQHDLALGLAAPALRIQAPVPGKQMVGIEVPNITTTTVTLRGVMESETFRKESQNSALPIALGSDVSGQPVVADLATMPHLLIAGATGSGKSVCLNAIITCLLMNHSPEQLRLVLIDPKRVELTQFSRVPHLAFSEIVVDLERVVGTLQAVINEMDSRYRRFEKAGVRDIAGYNENSQGTGLPYWVVIIDELADLMISAPYQVEHQIVRLAQLSRATGIHLVIATQRPSVDVVTGLIKANFPTRIAFAMSSQVDSRTVLDQAGADKLLGKGDMLYQPIDAQAPTRLQGVFVSDQESTQMVEFWTGDRFQDIAPEKHDDLLEKAERQATEMGTETPGQEDDPMVQKALELAKESNRISTSMLQRRLRIGYPRAARIMDELEERGIVGQPETSGSSRQVITQPDAASPLSESDSTNDVLPREPVNTDPRPDTSD